jgi:uncharacterized protein YjiS (DUF1127 family)
MANPLQRYKEYRQERRHIREALSLDNDNFW